MTRRDDRRTLLLIALVLFAAVPTIVALWFAVGSGPDDDRAVVLAPSSLAPAQDALDAALLEAGIAAPDWVFAGSQALAAQVADGAPADAVFTADRVTFDAVLAAGAVSEIESSFASNTLVVAVADHNPGEVRSIEAVANEPLLVGICAVDVPCGRLGAQVLAAYDIDARPDTEETSVRALTAKLASGELDVGLIYRTDAQASDLAIIDVDGIDAFSTTYWGTAAGEGVAVLDFLVSDDGQAVLHDAGFGPAQ